MRAAVANRHWGTTGGGEAYALAVTRSLERRGADVTLLGPLDTPWDRLADRFGVHPATEDVDFEDEEAVSRAGGAFDLFVNTGHATQLPNPAARGLLVVHFPRDHGVGLGRVQRRLLRHLVRRGRVRNPEVVWGRGFHAPGEIGRVLRWTDGDATLVLDPPPGPRTPVTLTFGTDRPTSSDVEVSAGDVAVATTIVPDEPRSVTVTTGRDRPGRLTVTSDTFVPADAWEGVDDRRPHGVPVVDVQVGDRLRSRVLDRLPAWRRSELLGFTTTYDALVCHSPYTAAWVERWWGLTPAVVEPPVTPRAGGDKAPVILAVGRFFDPRRGHSKRQLELVEAFRTLRNAGGAGIEAWELHLAGGCDEEDAPYLDAVRAAATGLPVEIHVDAPAAHLDDLYARASVFWHAAGLGVDPEVDPEAHEHFGIAVVEAMSAGAVPIVHGTGGPAGVVRHGVDGLHFRTPPELVETTRDLIADDATRDRMSAAASARSADFSFDVFHDRLTSVLESV